MIFISKTVHKCSLCGKEYLIKPPTCSCQSLFVKDAIIGWAKLVENKVNTTVKVQCLICGEQKDILYYNISRQKSCGCVPRGIDILGLTQFEIRYRCRKCGDVLIDTIPTKVGCDCGSK